LCCSKISGARKAGVPAIVENMQVAAELSAIFDKPKSLSFAMIFPPPMVTLKTKLNCTVLCIELVFAVLLLFVVVVVVAVAVVVMVVVVSMVVLVVVEVLLVVVYVDMMMVVIVFTVDMLVVR